MNKAELIDAVAKSTKQTKAQTEDTLNALMATVQNAMAKGNNVQLIGFGTLPLKSALHALAATLPPARN